MENRWAAVDDSIRRLKIQNKILSVALIGLYVVEAAVITACAIWIIAIGVRLGLQR